MTYGRALSPHGSLTAEDWGALAEAIFEHTPDFVWSADVEHFGLLTFNRSMREWFRAAFGIELSVGHRPEDAFPPGPFVERWYEIYRAAVRDGRHEVEYQSMLGRSLRFTLFLLRRSDGTPYALAAFGRDVTEQRRAEEAVQRREAFYRGLLEKSPDLAMVLGPDRSFKFVSSSVQALVGATSEQIAAGFMGHTFVHPDDRARAQDAFDSVIERPDASAQVTYRVRGADGTYRLYDCVLRNQLAEPEIGGIVLNARDVTEHHRLVDALHASQRMEGIGRLAGGIAHDFNNAMTVVLSSAELARAALSDGRAVDVDDLDAIIGAAERARDFTRQLLAFARKQPTAPRVISLVEVVRSNRSLVERILGEDVRVVLDLPDGDGLVRVDPSQMTQVLLNLATNARDAMPNGGTFTITVGSTTVGRSGPNAVGLAPGEYLTLSISDTGAGMTPEVAAQAFDPFFTTKEEGAGSGLGLSIVHGVVAQSDGHVSVTSRPGEGTTFVLAFPRATARPSTVAPQRATTRPVSGRATILLVEDDDRVRRLAERILGSGGYRVLAAPNGHAALAELERRVARGEAIDLLLTDVIMPGMDGRAVAERARSLIPGLAVLFMSGYTEERLTSGGELAPGVDLLQKPFTPVILRSRVREALEAAAALEAREPLRAGAS